MGTDKSPVYSLGKGIDVNPLPWKRRRSFKLVSSLLPLIKGGRYILSLGKGGCILRREMRYFSLGKGGGIISLGILLTRISFRGQSKHKKDLGGSANPPKAEEG